MAFEAFLQETDYFDRFPSSMHIMIDMGFKACTNLDEMQELLGLYKYVYNITYNKLGCALFDKKLWEHTQFDALDDKALYRLDRVTRHYDYIWSGVIRNAKQTEFIRRALETDFTFGHFKYKPSFHINFERLTLLQKIHDFHLKFWVQPSDKDQDSSKELEEILAEKVFY